MKLACLALLIVGCSCMSISQSELNDQWQLFKATHRTEGYASLGEEEYRRSVFEENYRKISQHNEEAAQGLHTWTQGVNHFSDLTVDEFMARISSKITPLDYSTMTPYPTVNTTVTDMDWRARGKVGPVKNQGQCGSCWAFASVAAIEGRLSIKRNNFRTLSEQEIVDCTAGYDCQHGGNIQMATATLNRLGGIEGDNDYPYISGGGGKGNCHYDGGRRVAHVGTNLQYVAGEGGMPGALNNGPLYVHVMASASFMHYNGGVFASGDCNAPINHAVTVVGYTGDAWIVKNSWGNWGEGGYIRIRRGQNMCRIGESPIWTDDIQ